MNSASKKSSSASRVARRSRSRYCGGLLDSGGNITSRTGTRFAACLGFFVGVLVTAGVLVQNVFLLGMDFRFPTGIVELISTPGFAVLRVFHSLDPYRWIELLVCSVCNGALGGFAGFFILDTGKFLALDRDVARVRGRAASGFGLSLREALWTGAFGLVLGCGVTLVLLMVPLISFGGPPSYYPILVKIITAPTSSLGLLTSSSLVPVWSVVWNGVFSAVLLPVTAWGWRLWVSRRGVLA